MTASALAPLTLTGFEAIPMITNGALELALRGNADMRVKGAFGQYLKDLDIQIRASGVPSVNVKMVDLYFVSSSCFQAIAAWVLLVASRPVDARYQVRFETHTGQTWQKRSLEAIQRVAPGVAVVL
jgi:hypothetical protein